MFQLLITRENFAAADERRSLYSKDVETTTALHITQLH